MDSATPSALWYYLTGQGEDTQNHGPFDVETMKGLFQQQFVTEDALVWTEGQEQWLPLKACHGLYSAIMFEDKPAATAPKDAELAQFEAAIAAIETGTEPNQPDGTEEPEEKEFVDDDGTKFIWSAALKKFVPEEMTAPMAAAPAGPNATAASTAAASAAGLQDTATAAAAAAEYTPEMMRFEAEAEAIPTLAEAQAEEEASAAVAENLQLGKRGSDELEPGADDAELEPAAKAARLQEGAEVAKGDENAPKVKQPKNNTSVYVTGIPDDATPEEIAEEFSRCGIIKRDDNGDPKIRIYKDKKTGMTKGDCLITFLQRPSVALAIKLMHERELRPGRGTMMTVQEAQFQDKGDRSRPKAAANDAGGSKGGSKPQGKGGSKGGRGKVSHKDRMLGWDGFDDTYKTSEVMVVLMNMFTLEEVTLSPEFEPELQQFAIDMCKDLGAIERVRVFKKNPSGVASMRFRVPDAANAAIARMQSLVLVSGMFEPQALLHSPTLEAEIVEDVLLKCEQLGLGRALATGLPIGAPIRVLRSSPIGTVAIVFEAIEAAHEAVLALQGLSYDGRTLLARAVGAGLWDGKTQLATLGQTADDEAARLEQYAKDLETS